MLSTGRRDSIGLPWPIDPTSEAVFGELTGDGPFPVKFAEAFGFGRENPTGTSDLVLSSPDGESGRPVGKGEGRGAPEGANWPWGGVFLVSFLSLLTEK